MGPLASTLIGLSAGFATGVWALLAYSHWKTHHPVMAAGYAVAGIASLTATGLLLTRLIVPPGIEAGPIGTPALLATLIGLPAHLALIVWLRARRIGA